MADDFSDQPVGSAVQNCPLAGKQDPPHWLEIELVGEDNVGLPWECYRVTLPNGEEVTGYLNEKGLARFEQIRPGGMCLIRFPDLDKDAWTRVGTQS